MNAGTSPSTETSPDGDGERRAHGTEFLHGELTGQIINAFYAVHGELGFGFLETVYQRALAVELYHRRFPVAREVPVSVLYKGVAVGSYRADLIVSDTVVIEVKSGEHPSEADRFQLLNYLRCSGKEVGLLLHFGPKATARRVVATHSGVAVESAE